jgi:hypothetical protein
MTCRRGTGMFPREVMSRLPLPQTARCSRHLPGRPTSIVSLDTEAPQEA